MENNYKTVVNTQAVMKLSINSKNVFNTQAAGK